MTRTRQTSLPSQRSLALRNRQRLRRIDLRFLRRIAQSLLRQTCPALPFDLSIHIVAASEVTRLNEAFLHHKGSTDVITFDYAEPAVQSEPPPGSPILLHGEIFVCAEEAVSQARRFHTTWQSELVRYVVHGVLHLLGHDDLAAPARRRMKAAEDALLRRLGRDFDFRDLSPAR
jgi:probable rRNA maturation factor